MTPKQKRNQNVIKHYKRSKYIVMIRRFILGSIAIAGLIKLIQLGLEYLQ